MDNKNYKPKKDLVNAPIDILNIINEQIEHSICKIECRNGEIGTGFFCIIPFSVKFHPLKVLVTNNHKYKK